VSTYYLRVNDLLTLTYIVSRKKNPEHYRIGVGDRLRIESKSDESLDREVQVQPDGIINLPLIGDVDAAGRTLKDFRDDLMERYGRIEQKPLVTVTPLDVNNGLQEILKAVTSQSRSAGQAIDLRVTPEGTIQAPGIGSVYVQGLTIEEARSELEARYASIFGPGLLVSPSLTDRAKSFVFVGGEVRNPSRYELEGPTTVMQAITLAGGFNVGANVREVVVFRRDENWCLKATKINVHRPLYGKDPCPVNDIWLRDNDLVIIPKQRILCADDVINLYFTRGIYAVFPITFVYDFSKGTTVIP
jgi:polysaccharide export outer membrane protein